MTRLRGQVSDTGGRVSDTAFAVSDTVRDPDRRRFIGAAGLTTAGLILGPAIAGAQDIRGRALTREVATSAGRIRGAVLDGDIQAFYGVPYGASTAGANRFMPPKPAEPWRGVRETINVGNRSPQPLPGPISEISALHRANPRSEDCLHVNVSTPALDNAARPVMVWFHGGGFYSGSGDWLLYDGANLARSQNVVVVTVTHRLGPFGFLHLPAIGGGKYAESSNVGMRDMLLALDWVHDNIENFGGNPDRVTLFGQSGGGGKVSVMTAMPGAQGHYHRAIVMSGSTLEVATADAATETAGQFVRETGVKDLDALQRVPWEQIEAAAERRNVRWEPAVDGTSLPAQPYSPAAPAMSADIPMLIGNTEYEACFFADTPLDPIDDAELERLVAMRTGADAAGVDALIATYRAGRPGVPNVDVYQLIYSDSFFAANAHTQAERKSALGRGAVYRYNFTWQSPVHDGKLKSYHCLDIPFAFDNVDVGASMTGGGQDRYALADRISGAFAAFARSGDPNHDGLPSWPRFTAGRRATMIFNDDCRVVDDPHSAERKAIAEVLASA